MIFGLFKKKVVTPPAPARPSIEIREVPDALFFVRESMDSLGYLLPAAEARLVAAMPTEIGSTPDHCQIDRRGGEQLSDAEKKLAGIRKNAMLSKALFDELTGKGRVNPLQAHAITLRRADFSMSRARNIARAQGLGCDEFEYMADGTHLCKSCDEMDGQQVSGAEAHVTPPAACTCETGRYVLRALISFD